MRSRQPIVHVLLALLLLFSQQVVLAHAFSHLAETTQRTTDNKQLPAEKTCDHYLAHAQVGAGLTSQCTLQLGMAGHDTVFARQPPVLLTATSFTAFQSRAPPSF
ncbi:MAG: hypothetical protein V4632_24120 [Pseudomonadota bacterium]